MKRPRSVTIIGLLLLLQGLFLALFGGTVVALRVASRLDALPANEQVDVPWALLPDMLSSTSTLVIGVFGLVSSIGLLRLRSWSWLMAMIVQGVSMILNLIDYTRGEANYLAMLFAAVVVFYLNRRDIRQVFNTAAYQQDRTGPAVARPGAAVAREPAGEAAHRRRAQGGDDTSR